MPEHIPQKQDVHIPLRIPHSNMLHIPPVRRYFDECSVLHCCKITVVDSDCGAMVSEPYFFYIRCRTPPHKNLVSPSVFKEFVGRGMLVFSDNQFFENIKT